MNKKKLRINKKKNLINNKKDNNMNVFSLF
jgi:hypothetical protein